MIVLVTCVYPIMGFEIKSCDWYDTTSLIVSCRRSLCAGIGGRVRGVVRGEQLLRFGVAFVLGGLGTCAGGLFSFVKKIKCDQMRIVRAALQMERL